MLLNVYAPNEDNQEFFASKLKEVEQYEYNFKIIGGDFNTILNPTTDKFSEAGSDSFNKQSTKFLNNYLENKNWVDPWRLLNPDKRLYTWSRSKPTLSFSHLDFWLVPLEIFQQVTHADILPGFLSDHSIIVLKIQILQNERGDGYWKLNDKILENEAYVQEMRNLISDTVQSGQSLNKRMLWESIKIQAISFSKEKSKRNASKNKEELVKLERHLKDLQDDLHGTASVDIYHSMQQKIDEKVIVQKKLDDLITEKTRGAMRSKANWLDGSEKTSKYFFNLEKRNYNIKTISRLHTHTRGNMSHRTKKSCVNKLNFMLSCIRNHTHNLNCGLGWITQDSVKKSMIYSIYL